MLFKHLNQSIKKQAPFLGGIFLFNTFAIKLFFDTGKLTILESFLFFHFTLSAIICLFFVSQYRNQNLKNSVYFSLCALPTFLYLIQTNQLALLELVTYLFFSFSVQAGLIGFLTILSPIKKNRQLYGFFILICMWGATIIIESIPAFFYFFSPLIISYHYSLITSGTLHITSVIYSLFFIGVFIKSNHETTI